MDSEPKSDSELPLLIADLYEAAGAVRRRGDALASLAGQTQARWQVLSALSDGGWTVPRAARRLGVTRQAVQRTVDALRADALVEIEHNPDHQRSPLIALTDQGRDALAAITNAGTDWNTTLESKISAQDIQTTRAVLRALVDNA
jgi:DNA-binding MarR family transcriptional regulator